jgi:hypothetical protein
MAINHHDRKGASTMIARVKALTMFFVFLVAGALLVGSLSAGALAQESSSRSAAALPASASTVRPGASVNGFGANEICTIFGVGASAAGLAKAVAKGASFAGMAAAMGCYAYSQISAVTPAQARAATLASYNRYNAMTDLQKLNAQGYGCRKITSGGGGTDTVIPNIGTRTIVMKGVSYSCTNMYD